MKQHPGALSAISHAAPLHLPLRPIHFEAIPGVGITASLFVPIKGKLSPVLGFMTLALLGFFFLQIGWNTPGALSFAAVAILGCKLRGLPYILPRPGMAFVWLTGFLLFLYALFSVAGFLVYLPYKTPPGPLHFAPYLVLGFFLMLGGSSFFKPENVQERGISRWTARIVLAVILGVGAWIRLRHFQEANPAYWFDYALSMVDGRNALEYPADRYLIFPTGCRQPFYQYLVVLSYWLFPHLPSVTIQNILWGLIDLTAIWVHYLLGREVGGRRVGLLLAALMAISKPPLINCMSGQSPVSTPLALGVLLLFTFRFLSKTDLKHALQWGAAVAFGFYCYTTVKPFLGWVPVFVLAAVLARCRQQKDAWFWTLGGFVLFSWSYLFFHYNRYLPSFGKALHLPGDGLLPAFALGLVLPYWIRQWRKSPASKETHLLAVTLSGLGLAALLSLPMVLHPLFAEWSSAWSVFGPASPERPPGGVVTLSFLADRFLMVFRSLFAGLGDRQDMGRPGEPFFNLQAVPLIAAGLAWAWSRGGWKSAFLVSCALLGAVPHAISWMSHTGRLMGLVTPLFLLAALSVDGFLGALSKRAFSSIRITMAVLVLMAYATWTVKDMNDRFYTSWPKTPSDETVILRWMKTDASSRRVYLLEDSFGNFVFSIGPLVDGVGDLFRFHPGGVAVPALPGERAPDVALYFSGSRQDIFKRLQTDFPHARLIDTWRWNQTPGAEQSFMVRALIPGSDLKPLGTTGPPPLFYRKDAPSRPWTRRFYAGKFGLGHGMIDREDKVEDPLAPLPIQQPMSPAVIEGKIRIVQGGYYRFMVESSNFAVLDVGERRILDLRWNMRGKVPRQYNSVWLKPGEYRVRLSTYFQTGLDLPQVKVRAPGEETDRHLGSFAS